MNADRLLSHFERISDAPDAVDRLRRFILDLAVRGKLVPAEIGSATSDLPDGTRTQPTGKALDLPLDTLPFVVPSTWRWAYLTSIATVQYGFAFASSQFNAERRGMPLIRIRDIARRDTEAYYEGQYERCYIVSNGDYLVGMDGDFNVRQWHGPKALLNQRVLRITEWHSEAYGPWCVIPLQMILDHVHGQTSQTTVKHLSAKQMNGIRIPLPPLAEQHRIVEKVDELMNLCDRLETSQKECESRRDRLVVASLNRLSQPTDPDEFQKDAGFQLSILNRLSTKPEHIKELRKAISNLAVRGNLVPQDPKEEKAEQLLQRIAKQREELVTTGHMRNRRSSQKSKTEALHDLPASWTQAFLGVVCQVVQGFAFSSEAFTEDSQQGMPLIRIGDIGADKTQMFVKTESLPEYTVYPGDLLLGLSGSIRSARWNGPPSLLNQRIACIRPIGDELDNRWIDLWLSTYLATLIEKTSKLTVLNVKAAQLYEAPIPLPPLAEQKRIVAKVDELMLICDQLENQLESQRKGRRQFLEALLHEALEGVG